MQLQHAGLLVGEIEPVAAAIKIIHPGKQLAVEHDGALVGGKLGRNLALDRLQILVGVGAGQVEEHGAHPVQGPAAALQGGDGVGEAGARRLAHNARDLRLVLL